MAGRPKKITEEKLRLLKEGFLKDLTDEQACQYADVKPSTFYDYQAAHPEFSEQKKLWKTNIGLKAKINIATAIEEGDKELSKWYAERKMKDEFSTKVEQELTNITPQIVVATQTDADYLKKIADVKINKDVL